jgi:hypothetical protein
VTFTATVLPQATGSNTPQGSVTFFIDGVPQGPVALSNGTASITLTLPAGPHTVTATYSGDVSFTTSTGAVHETVLGITDVSGLVTATRVSHKHHGNTFKQTFMLQNMSGMPITGPLDLLLDGLTGGVMLMNATGLSQTHVKPGDPFVMVPVMELAPGQSVMVDLVFNNPRHKNISFTTFVLAGMGTV